MDLHRNVTTNPNHGSPIMMPRSSSNRPFKSPSPCSVNRYYILTYIISSSGTALEVAQHHPRSQSVTDSDRTASILAVRTLLILSRSCVCSWKYRFSRICPLQLFTRVAFAHTATWRKDRVNAEPAHGIWHSKIPRTQSTSANNDSDGYEVPT